MYWICNGVLLSVRGVGICSPARKVLLHVHTATIGAYSCMLGTCHVLRAKVFWCDPLNFLLWTFLFEPGKCHGMCPQLRFAIPIRCERRFLLDLIHL